MPAGLQGAIFDVDGVVVDSPHERAWREALASLMETSWRSIRDRTSYAPERFTSDLYHEAMSGKPTMSGARAALEYFDVPDVEDRIQPYGERKQRIVDEILATEGVTSYPDALRFFLAVRDAGIRTAAASSSKNASILLGRIRVDAHPGRSLLDLFDVDVSGRDFGHGKPDPEIFLTAAAELGIPPSACLVVEDAVSGIQAANAAGMVALAVARAVEPDVLAAAQADLVVGSLDEVDLSALAEGRLAVRSGRSSAARDPRESFGGTLGSETFTAELREEGS